MSSKNSDRRLRVRLGKPKLQLGELFMNSRRKRVCSFALDGSKYSKKPRKSVSSASISVGPDGAISTDSTNFSSHRSPRIEVGGTGCFQRTAFPTAEVPVTGQNSDDEDEHAGIEHSSLAPECTGENKLFSTLVASV